MNTDSISRKEAGQLLRIGQRRLRDLLREGRLTAENNGYNRRVTAPSLANELKRRDISTLSTPKCGNLTDSLPTFSRAPIDSSTNEFENKVMYVNSTTNGPIGELLPLTRAANEIGVSDSVMTRMVRTGQLPSVAVGNRRRVNREALRAWARGELTRPAQHSDH